jgi:hypothetical protein
VVRVLVELVPGLVLAVVDRLAELSPGQACGGRSGAWWRWCSAWSWRSCGSWVRQSLRSCLGAAFGIGSLMTRHPRRVAVQ